VIESAVWEAVERKIHGLGKSAYIHILFVESTNHENPTAEKQVGEQ
jgi:hypothetical protein